MSNLARIPRAPAARLLALLTALFLTAAAMNAIAAPAGARGLARHNAHASRASRAAVHLTVVAGQLVWSPIDGVSNYFVRRRLDGHHTRRIVAGTSFSLNPA